MNLDPKKETVTMNTVQFRRKVRKFATKFQYFAMSPLVLMSVWPSLALAQDSHLHPMPMQQELTAEQKSQQSALINKVRESTERFKDVAEAEREGYALGFGCVSGPDQGAMGLHFINMYLVGKGIIDPAKPQM